jgi:hypothetical protein
MVAVSFNVAGNRSTRLSSCYFVRFWLVTLVTIWVLVFFVRLRIFTLAAVSSFVTSFAPVSSFVTLAPVRSFVILFSFCFSYCCSCLSSCSFVRFLLVTPLPPSPILFEFLYFVRFQFELLLYLFELLFFCSVSLSYPCPYKSSCSFVRFRF